MDSREVLDDLDRQIERVEAQLKLLKSARAAHKKLVDMPQGEDSPSIRFYNMRPLIAARQILTEHEKPMLLDELRQILIDGGITIGKKRGVHNINKGIEISVGINELTSTGTGKNEKIGLPEWSKKR
jgi:hypothetical protein